MPNIEVIVGQIAVNDPYRAAAKRDIIWVSPLAVSFSQNVIYPRFTDGRSVDDVVDKVTAEEYSSDENKFDLTLEAPFPVIEAVYWSPKLRDGEGKPLLGEDGSQRRGVEALFSLDNRRLYALQRAAVVHYPKRCRTKVAVITDKTEIMRHLKKFRTRTNGLSITISEWNGIGRNNAQDYNAMRVWDWRSAVAAVSSLHTEGLQTQVDAASSGSCGSWEYLDFEDVCRGPFSNWQMRQWWERKMVPESLRVRPYNPEAARSEKGSTLPFRPVHEVFEDAPAPFAVGWSPRAADLEQEWKECSQCRRHRLEGWHAYGQWYCTACWKKWDSSDTPKET